MKKETIEKIKKCKALEGKSVIDLVALPRFQDNLARYWTSQLEDRKVTRQSYEAIRKAGRAHGYHLPAHVIDKLAGMSTEDLSVAFVEILYKTSERPAAERKYIYQLGMQAYSLTVSQYVVEEFPELKEELLPTQKHS